MLIMKVKTECREGIQVAPQRNLCFTILWGKRPVPEPCWHAWHSGILSDKVGIKVRRWLRLLPRTLPMVGS